MSRFYNICWMLGLMLFGGSLTAQQKAFDAVNTGNPLIPGYFADPTVKKFGDTYYIYATTDGNGGGFGPAQVWMSKDFVNWSLQDMNWPTTHYYWAPDVTQAPDGKYYMYYCQPVEIFGAWAKSPVGPWTPLLPPEQPVVKNFLVPNVITLDGQTFRDDDGKMYMFWGTWGIYPDHGCGVGLLNPDMKSFAKLAQIPNTVAKDFFEAPFMFKRKGIYYLTYSSGRCEDDTYRVQYATSKTGPMGPFVFGKNNPVLSTNADGTVHGPGHQSVLQQGEDFYLIYHRHNNPHSGGGYHRQVAADQLVFDAEGNIEKLVPTHNGVGFLAKNQNPSADQLLGKPVTASSVYSEDFKPEFVTDHNNGTLWKPVNNTSESWISMDMGAVKRIQNVQTQFEYATWYYQYMIEYSLDGKVWEVFADRTKNTVHGSPMIDTGDVKARYLKLTITNTEYPGLNKAVWNIRAFADNLYHPQMAVKPKDPATTPHIKPQGLLVDLDAGIFEQGAAVKEWKNPGKLGGSFFTGSETLPIAEMVDGKKAVLLTGKSFLKSDFDAPVSLSGNSSFTVAMWLNNPVIEEEEPVVSWTARGGIDMTNAAIGYGSNKKWGAAAHWGWADMPYHKLPAAGQWHHIALVFDGTTEKLYVDGILDRKELKMLFLANLTKFVLGTTADKNAFYSGAIASLKVYDIALTEKEITDMASVQTNSAIAIYLNAAKLPYGPISTLKNEGFAGGIFTAEKENTLTGSDQITNTKSIPAAGNGKMAGRKANITAEIEVADSKGKIALVMKDKAMLTYRLPGGGTLEKDKGFSVVSVLRGSRREDKWIHLVQVFQGENCLYYRNGLSAASLMGLTGQFGFVSVKDGLLTIGGNQEVNALASVAVYNHAFDANGVSRLYQLWEKNSSPAFGSTDFKTKPTALTTTMVTMSATTPDLPGRVFQYNFSEKTGRTGAAGSGWIDVPDYNNYALEAGNEYAYSLKVKDNYGNVTPATPPAKVKTAMELFTIADNNFEKPANLLTVSPKPFWDGLLGKADVAGSGNGVLQLASTDTQWDGGGQRGPFLYKNVTGDFIVQVNVTDVSGLKEKKARGANDAGLMVLAEGSINLIQNSIFPGWGIGNMVTSLDSNGRAQNNNLSAWNFYPHLQIQRSGKLFFLRGSSDGLHWKDLPGSPLLRPDMGKTLQVGLFQATYGKQNGYGRFDDFKLIQQVKSK